MKAIAIIVNFFIPGVGSLFVGKIAQGIVQFILYSVGAALTFTLVLAIIGWPMMVIAWIWGLITAATANPEPIRVTVIHQNAPNSDKDS